MPEMIDHYRIDHMLGQGGMGVVYQATDMNLQRPVAIKIMHPHLAANPEFQQRFLQEARAAASLEHPNIVRVLYFGVQGDQAFLVMDLITGGSLRDYLQHLHLQQASLELPELAEFGRQIADALDYAHNRGMIHRDVKPDNVLLKPVTNGNITVFQAMLTDFGLAKLEQSLVHSVPGQTMGTFAYMSPEQCRGEEVDGRSDIYSLGVMLYELATGRLPFLAKTLTEAIRMHTSDPVPDPKTIRPGLPDSLVEIIMRCLAKNPADRYQMAGEMAGDLGRVHQALINQPTIPEPPSVPTDSMAVYLASQPGTMRRSTIASRPPASSSQRNVDQLIVVSEAGGRQVVPLTKERTTIGRDPSSDVVLSSDQVSRNHAIITRRREGGYTITDLGSMNGTWLNNNRIPPNAPQNWTPGQPIVIGEFQLTVEPARTPSAARATDQHPAVAPAAKAAPKISARLLPDVVEVRPGGQTEMTVEVLNQGDTTESFVIQIPNVPREWVSYPTEALQLLPGDRGNFRVRFRLPPSGVTAGQFPFQVQVSSPGRPGITVNGTLRIAALSSFVFDLQPRRLSRSGDALVIVTNTGNAPDNYTIYGTDPNNSLVFNITQAQFSLPPGETGQIPIQVLPLKRPLIGGTSLAPFDVTVQAASLENQPQTQSAELLINSTVPTWALGAVPVACLGMLVCLLLLLSLVSGRNSANLSATRVALGLTSTESANDTATALFGTMSPSPEETPTLVPLVTDTPVSFYPPAEQPTPTSIFDALNQTYTAQAMSNSARASQTVAAQTSIAINNQQAAAALTATAFAAAQIAMLQTVTVQVGQLTQVALVQTSTGQAGAQISAIQSATALAVQIAAAQQIAAQTGTAQGAIQAALNQTATAQSLLVAQAAASQTANAVIAATAAKQTISAAQTATKQAQIAAQAATQTSAAQTAVVAANLTATAHAQQTLAAAGAAQTATLHAQQTLAALGAAQTATAVAQQTAAVAAALTATAHAQQTLAAAGAAQTATVIAQQTATAAAANKPQFIEVAGPTNTSNNVVVITNPAVNSNGSALLFVTSNFSPHGVYNPHSIGVLRSGTTWAVLNEDGAAMPANAAFNVDALNPAATVFTHTANATNTAGHITSISNPATDNHPNDILIVTQSYSPGNVANPHAIGVWYDPSKNKWTVFNEDKSPIPANATFNVQVLNPGANAFKVEANGPNINGSAVYLDNPAFNGHPEAIIVASQLLSTSNVFNPHDIGVSYDTGANKWTIFNEDPANPADPNGPRAPMPAGAFFFVKIAAP